MLKKELSDEDYWKLYKAFCKGDQRASKDLVDQLGKRLYNYVKKINYNLSKGHTLTYTCEEDFQDCVEHTWEKLIENCTKPFKQINFWSIASTIAKCKLFDDWRKIMVEKRNLGEKLSIDDDTKSEYGNDFGEKRPNKAEWENSIDPSVNRPKNSEELAMIEQFFEFLEFLPENQQWGNIFDPYAKTPDELEKVRQFIEAVTLLPEKQRAALILQLEGYSKAEIADITEEKVETAKNQIRLAKDKIKKFLFPETGYKDTY
ncbi:RNA polymerase sigma factor [Crenothrix polyspora]|uniref:Putative RNA polymerase, sigma-24 subunit, ECF subfamily n=1 Tax=Crenothrix polyspora TaxID=360316 RepID=A0A1R4HE41_9GAMM|nr:RNA polymerase sigma factor [Crenothrix polyspora]SJM94484.1 putative RNA polymerase, sigma-24 subunit, ECF subfamily [Crenothrix polyspora]